MKSFVATFFLFLFLSQSAFADVPPGKHWFTLHTEHFRVHHTQEQENYAKEFTKYLEIALPKLTKDLGWTPHTPIDVVINDKSDFANGFAMSFPANRLEVYAVPFETESVLMDYYNWVEELAIHELTHIIANDTSLGFYKPLRSIFGNLVKPNGLQPIWIVEGLAVYEETAQTIGGRGRSALTETVLRTAAHHNQLDSSSYLSLDRFNNGVFWWPSGNTPYLLGYTIQSAAELENSDSERSVPGRISTYNASKIPFRVNSNLDQLISQDWRMLWEKTITRLNERYPITLPLDTENPHFCRLTEGGRFTGGHTISPDKKWIYFTLEHKNHGSSLARIPLPEFVANCSQQKPEILVHKKYGGPSQVSISPDGKTLAFSMARLTSAHTIFDDIFLFDLDKKSTKSFTEGLRAKDPIFLENGESIAYIRNLGNNMQSIEIQNIKTRNSISLFRSKNFERLSNLTERQGKIYFSLHNNSGQEEIFSIPTAGGDISPAISSIDKEGKGESFFERYPFFDSEGNLYFSANYKNVENENKYNIFVLRANSGKIEKIAESSSGMLLRPILLQGNRLLCQNYYLDGFDLTIINLNNMPPSAPPSPNIEKNIDLHEFLTNKTTKEFSAAQTILPSHTKNYSIFSTPATSLWPQYWIPIWEANLDGAYFGVTTSGSDPLEQNTYNITMLYDTRADFPVYQTKYSNRSYSVGFDFFANQDNAYFQGSQTSNRVSLYGAEAVFSFPLSSYAAGAAFQDRKFFQSKSQSIFIYNSFAYSNIEQIPTAIDPNRGQYFATYLGLHPAARFEKDYLESNSKLQFYSPGTHPSHSIAAKANFAITTNKFLASNYYLGGGATFLDDTNFLVRGYPSDTLLGQKITTLNISYTLPLARPYRGLNTKPIFLKNFGLRLLGDAGSANFLARYDNKGTRFLGYTGSSLGQRILVGTGVDTVLQGTLFYYIPTELVLGLHYGLKQNYGGSTMFYLNIKSALGLTGKTQ